MVKVKVMMSQCFMIWLMDFIGHNGRWNTIDNHVTGGDRSKIVVLNAL